MRKQSKRYLFLFFSLAALLLGLSGTSMVFAQGHARLASLQKAASLTCGTWSVVTSPNVSSSTNQLNGVAALSVSDTWAVGYSVNSTNVDQTLIEQWNGTSWSIVASPDVGTSSSLLYGVAAVSTSDIWAVGYFVNSAGINRTLIEQWNGTSWSIVASPNVGTNGNLLFGVAAVSASDIWAVGSYESSSTGISKNLTMHWNGTSWSAVVSPNGPSSTNVLTSVAAVSTSDIWAVGYYQNSTSVHLRTSTLHWNGTKWSPVASPSLASNNNMLLGVATVSTSDVWTVGESSGRTNTTLTLHWNGTNWSYVSSPNASSDNALDGVAAVSASDAWAVGHYFNSSNDAFQTLIEQWNGTSWSIVASPNVGSGNNELLGVAALSTGDAWAVGYSGSGGNTLIEFYC